MHLITAKPTFILGTMSFQRENFQPSNLNSLDDKLMKKPKFFGIFDFEPGVRSY